MHSRISNKLFSHVYSDIFSHLEDNEKRCVIQDNSLKKINSLLSKFPLFSLVYGLKVIEKIQKLHIVKEVNYDIVKNEEVMEFHRLEIIFKENT
jgi:lysine/ornithine N-monooxygenase